MDLQKWHDFWNRQTAPLHRADTDEHYRRFGSELRILFGERPIESVLEIGCGNGAMYPYLGFDRAQYTGVDYSQSMLDDFRRKHPDAHLVCGDGSSYRDDRQYQLIFSNGVVQYFTDQMLRKHIESAVSMLTPDGSLIMASVPCREMAIEAYRGGPMFGLHRERPRGWWNARLRWMLRHWEKVNMGQWRSLDEMRLFALEFGLTPTFMGSMHYMYRFHAIFQLDSPNFGGRHDPS